MICLAIAAIGVVAAGGAALLGALKHKKKHKPAPPEHKPVAKPPEHKPPEKPKPECPKHKHCCGKYHNGGSKNEMYLKYKLQQQQMQIQHMQMQLMQFYAMLRGSTFYPGSFLPPPFVCCHRPQIIPYGKPKPTYSMPLEWLRNSPPNRYL
ncbi:hypothetical protein CS022_20515 [Veronia nyctiphanis]|uniref:Uncharacterized protein n=1 Tax=Veronia nyctiphanis TaxID=1278244 RepID=A0A4Q0YLE8_9GAMM|nr:hypothetical protein [Veronia nyctiphanis]RXJ71590.1 hypothetical protein CS022_20515 [Veronia nyctiphanis]